MLKRKRNYSINGPENKWAHERGLASADWYATPIPRKRLKELMARKDGPGIRDTLIWFGLLAISGFLAYYSWGTWWAIPAFAVYGILYSTAASSRHHECAHGTAFRSIWINEVVFQISSFMRLKLATSSRWSHTWHHTDTIIVGLDPEIVVRPPVWRVLLGELFRLQSGLNELEKMWLNCLGKLNATQKLYIPASQSYRAFWEARIYALLLLAIIVWSFYIQSLLPLLFIGLPTFYGSFVLFFYIFTQHLGLSEDVLDHRLNSRTVYMNPINRFLYWNMNYHIEHHMFPMVPYYSLPALHEEMKHDYPSAAPSIWSAFKEILAALQKQRNDIAYCIIPALPVTARPYQFGPIGKEEGMSGKLNQEGGL